MSDYRFRQILNTVLSHEGGWSDHPADKGGPTYKGITSRWYPDWPGWKIIDELRNSTDFPQCLSGHAPLQVRVSEFYWEEYWAPLRCDDIQSNLVAGKLFDTAINIDKSDATRILQRCLNTLNVHPSNPDLEVDGRIGPVTVATVNTYIEFTAGGELALLAYMKSEQGHHYVEQGLKNRSQRAFTKGWTKRLRGE